MGEIKRSYVFLFHWFLSYFVEEYFHQICLFFSTFLVEWVGLLFYIFNPNSKNLKKYLILSILLHSNDKNLEKCIISPNFSRVRVQPFTSNVDQIEEHKTQENKYLLFLRKIYLLYSRLVDLLVMKLSWISPLNIDFWFRKNKNRTRFNCFSRHNWLLLFYIETLQPAKWTGKPTIYYSIYVIIIQ